MATEDSTATSDEHFSLKFPLTHDGFEVILCLLEELKFIFNITNYPEEASWACWTRFITKCIEWKASPVPPTNADAYWISESHPERNWQSFSRFRSAIPWL